MGLESFATEAEDLILQRLLDALVFKDPPRTGFYLDIGAYHPVMGSNTHFFYKRGWRGVNVEPNPQYIPDFQRERPEDVTLNVGISDVAGMLEYHRFEMAVLNGFYGQDLVDTHIRGGQKYLGSTTVECLATVDFLAQYATKPIDILNLDIETREPQVLTNWDWANKRPKLICVEIHAMTALNVAESWVAKYLMSRDYLYMSRVWQSAFFMDRAYRIN